LLIANYFNTIFASIWCDEIAMFGRFFFAKIGQNRDN